MDSVISEPCYKGTILQRNEKMTILWPFSYNSFVKFHGKKWEPQHDCVITRVCYKGTAL